MTALLSSEKVTRDLNGHQSQEIIIFREHDGVEQGLKTHLFGGPVAKFICDLLPAFRLDLLRWELQQQLLQLFLQDSHMRYEAKPYSSRATQNCSVKCAI